MYPQGPQISQLLFPCLVARLEHLFPYLGLKPSNLVAWVSQIAEACHDSRPAHRSRCRHPRRVYCRIVVYTRKLKHPQKFTKTMCICEEAAICLICVLFLSISIFYRGISVSKIKF